jgi:predicted RNA binding protein YcfA (HicA-like mRNA interferase family)
VPELPGVSHRRAIKALQKAGFSVAREGIHVVMTDGTRIITLPRANPINGHTMGGIIRDAGLTIEEFKKLL